MLRFPWYLCQSKRIGRLNCHPGSTTLHCVHIRLCVQIARMVKSPRFSTGQAPSRQGPVKPSSTRPKEVRERNGCFTCRVRRKACSNPRRSHSTPEQYPSVSCDDCQRYGIQCLGYGFNRPEWLLEKVGSFAGSSNVAADGRLICRKKSYAKS
ncbi:hypothetical protein DL93DRAFT_966191 [Clavulina sp. PMI_390]|nr:hypothetical protein DL93DRAFT_966191 [Clavulina sp. PMI_390]